MVYKLVKLTIMICALLVQLACSLPSDVREPLTCEAQVEMDVISSQSLSVLTLNLAHGRKDAFNQMLQRTSTTRQNLEEIAVFLSSSGADVIALQEADLPSRWSGRFNHVEFISQRSPYPCRIHASNAKKYMYDFGTALLSTVPFTASLEYTFEPSPPTTNKGFVMGEVKWNPGNSMEEAIRVSIISVHLDFSRKRVRDAQIEEMRAVLSELEEPVIILGDFNADWYSRNSAIKAIVENGNFKVYRPDATDLGTYKFGKKRLDWILISNDLEFASYEVAPDVLSDHQAVMADIRLIDTMDE